MRRSDDRRADDLRHLAIDVSAPLLVFPAAESLTTKSEGNLKRAISAGPFLKKASADSLAGDYSQVSHILRQLRLPLQCFLRFYESWSRLFRFLPVFY